MLSAVWSIRKNPLVAGKDNHAIREVRRISLSIRQAAIIEYLKKFIQNNRIGLNDIGRTGRVAQLLNVRSG